MDAKVDWLSFSLQLGETHPELGWTETQVMDHFVTASGFQSEEWSYGKPRAPYAHCLRVDGVGISLYWSGRLTHCLCEVSGTGCQFLRSEEKLISLITCMVNRITRIDLATDFSTEVLPNEFVNQRSAKTHKTRASFNSSSGQTEYVGSRKSQLMARVYRYSSPHPRSELLRVEHECKAETAKSVGAYLLANGVEQAQRQLGSRFGWCHPLWSGTNTDLPPLSIPSQTREEAKTDLWLRTQCAAAFKKLVATGAIADPEAYLREVFLKETLYQ